MRVRRPVAGYAARSTAPCCTTLSIPAATAALPYPSGKAIAALAQRRPGQAALGGHRRPCAGRAAVEAVDTNQQPCLVELQDPRPRGPGQDGAQLCVGRAGQVVLAGVELAGLGRRRDVGVGLLQEDQRCPVAAAGVAAPHQRERVEVQVWPAPSSGGWPPGRSR